MACEPNDLINLARCFSCLTLPQLLEVQTYLLCTMSESGAFTGGTGSVGTSDPEGSVTANTGSIYYNSNNATLWVKQSGSGNTGWVQLI